MSTIFNAAEIEADHLEKTCAGIESLALRIREGQSLQNLSGNEAYAASVLSNEGMNLRNIDGSEGFVKDAFYKVSSAMSWLGLRIFQYGWIVDRFIVSKVSTAVFKIIYRERDAKALAKESLYSPEDIIKIINDPVDEENKIKKLEELAGKGLDDTYGFKIAQAGLYPIISHAKQRKGAKQIVEDAVASAGSVDKLLSKHRDVSKDIDVDTTAFRKIYDKLSVDKKDVIKSIQNKLDAAAPILKEAQDKIGGDLWLKTYPNDLKKVFDLTKDFGNDVSIVSRSVLVEATKVISEDIKKLQDAAKSIKGSVGETESKLAVASKLLKIYVGILDELMNYELQVNKAQIYAITASSEALYKIIIAAAEAEIKEK